MSGIPDGCTRRRALVMAVGLAAWCQAPLPAQARVDASVAGGVLRVKAAGSDLSVLARPGGPAVTQGRESFNLGS